MAKATLSKGLVERLAAGPVRRKVEAVTVAAERETRDRAPDAKTWVTDGGENVRPAHAAVNGQTSPGNLSYKLPRMVYVRKGRGPVSHPYRGSVMHQMNRVAIVGSSGSGKSHLARELASILGAPVIHLDAVYFDEEWEPLPAEKFEAAQRALVADQRWVIDGNYNSTLRVRLEACDTVVMMDVPTWAALWGIVSRQVRYGRGQHGAGVYNRIHWGVVKYVATYRRQMRLKVLAKIERFARGKTVIYLTSRRHTRRWLKQVTAES
ncbi:P-loop NTPase family protein [Streptosporangium soli]|nr:hypothetical protein [Streptosporangium sp. KLBMP 9127]